ncbi:hemoglobin, alpha embryonic 5 isoform X1 [Ictalurus furcatus]|uniref:hemoglobin, alpha embryonic 5 isoform X1 n=1 Tax=Ictalurus furcatus TaxID=66913 RepID=UPI00234FD170|nr:hemoglobin, alpha embryonic 5 isoform X1 [Ictalurus furcatus]
MSLSENDKQMVKTLWAKISPAADQLGCEALSRLATFYTFIFHLHLHPHLLIDVLFLGLANELPPFHCYCRMFLVFPQTKTYFAHWPDLSLGSDSVKKHGKKVMDSVGEAVNNIDNLFGGLSSLSELHAFQLRIDPTNFKILSHNILVVIANRFPDDFSVEAHLSLEKFFARVALAMSDKYR